MKEKVIAVLMYVVIFIIGLVLMPPPAAEACFEFCAQDYCVQDAAGDNYMGFARHTSVDDNFVMLEYPECTSMNDYSQLYYACSEFLCSSMSASGHLYVTDGGKVSIFTVRNKQESNDILHFIWISGGQTHSLAVGINSAVKKFSTSFDRTMLSKDFDSYHRKLLASIPNHNCRG